MANKRHPDHDAILDMILSGTPWKVIAHKFNTTERIVQGIADRWTTLVRVKKFDPGEGQLSFIDRWKNMKPFRRSQSV